MRQKGMRKLLLAWVLCAHFQHARAQYDYTPITRLLTDSAGVIGQSGQNLGFMIVRGDSVLFEKYWGSWNNTTYQPIASGSKMPSMALLMKLVNDGRLSLSDTVQRFIPAFRNKPVITLGQLMSHTSGLPGISPYISNNGFTLKQAADSIGLRTPMTSFAPGSAFQYGGVSMHVAGRMAEVATGMRWDSLFQKEIGRPLGLANTNYAGTGATTNFRIAGGMGTTMPDFSKLLSMLLQYGWYKNQQIMDSLTVVMMQSNQTGILPLIGTPYANDPLREDFRYGYGVWVEQENNGQTTQFGSQGAFGFTPWIDRCRNIACVLFVRRSLGIIQPTHTELRKLVEQIIPVKLEKPVISFSGSRLQSSYTSGNQWYFNHKMLPGENSQYLNPSASGTYTVRYMSREGCDVFSDSFAYNTLSMGDQPVQERLRLYPNPVDRLLFADCPDGYKVYNATGQLLLYSRQATQVVDVSDLRPGMYLLQAGVGRAEKFIKTK